MLDKLNFWADYYEAGKELSKRDRLELWDALISYAFEGVEPTLKGAPKAVFIALRGRVDASVKGAAAAKASKAPKGEPSQAPSEAPSQGYPEAPSEGVAGEPSQGSGENPARDGRGTLPTVQEYRSTGVQEGVCGVNTPRDTPRAEGASQGSDWDPRAKPPDPSEVKAYFEANCLKGDPERFVNVYAAQGWKRGNGRAIEDWRAQAQLWSADQPRFDQIEADRRARSAKAAGVAPPGEKWRPAKGEDIDGQLERLREQMRREGVETGC